MSMILRLSESVPRYLEEVLTTMEQTLPASETLQHLDPVSVANCLTFVCDFMSCYFSAAGSGPQPAAARSLMMAVFRLDVLHSFDADVASRVRAAWTRAARSLSDAADPELADCVSRMLAVVVGSVADVGQTRRLSEIVFGLWRTSSRFFDDVVLTRALELNRSVLLRSPASLASVLDLRLFLDTLDGFGLSRSLYDSRAVALAALAANFLLARCENGHLSCSEVAVIAESGSTEDDADDVSSANNGDSSTSSVVDTAEAELGMNLEMLVDIAVAIVCVESAQEFTGRRSPAHRELREDFGALIGRLSDAEAELLILRVVERSMGDGKVWTLVLELILRNIESRDKLATERCLPSDLECFVPLTLSTASTLCVVLPQISRDICPSLAEITTALMLSCETGRIAAFEGKYTPPVSIGCMSASSVT